MPSKLGPPISINEIGSRLSNPSPPCRSHLPSISPRGEHRGSSVGRSTGREATAAASRQGGNVVWGESGGLGGEVRGQGLRRRVPWARRRQGSRSRPAVRSLHSHLVCIVFVRERSWETSPLDLSSFLFSCESTCWRNFPKEFGWYNPLFQTLTVSSFPMFSSSYDFPQKFLLSKRGLISFFFF